MDTPQLLSRDRARDPVTQEMCSHPQGQSDVRDVEVAKWSSQGMVSMVASPEDSDFPSGRVAGETAEQDGVKGRQEQAKLASAELHPRTVQPNQVR